MPTELNGDQEKKQGVATLSPEFLSGGTEADLEKIRTRLLDLTNRNKLLNFRHGKVSTMRVVNVDPDAVFRKLVDGQKLPFLPVPEPDPEFIKFVQDENQKSKAVKPAPGDYAKEVGWEVDYDLDDQAYQSLTCDRDLFSKTILPVAMKYSRADFAKTEQFLEVYARHLTAVQCACNELAHHPWAWVRRPVQFAEEERLLDLVTRLCQVIGSAVEYCGRLESTACYRLGNSLLGLLESGKVLEVLPTADGSIHLHLLEHCRDARVRSSLESFLGKIEDANRARAEINEATQDRGEALLGLVDDQPLRNATKTLAELGFGHESLTDIGKALDGFRQAERELADSQRLFQEVIKTLGCDPDYSANCLELALETIQIIEGAPFEILHLRRVGFQADGAARTIRAASEIEIKPAFPDSPPARPHQ